MKGRGNLSESSPPVQVYKWYIWILRCLYALLWRSSSTSNYSFSFDDHPYSGQEGWATLPHTGDMEAQLGWTFGFFNPCGSKYGETRQDMICFITAYLKVLQEHLEQGTDGPF